MSVIFLDTNIIISDPNVLETLEFCDVYISSHVLRELDNKKIESGLVGKSVRYFLKFIDRIVKCKSREEILAGIIYGNNRIFLLGDEHAYNIDDHIIEDAVSYGGSICSNDRVVRIKSAIKGVPTFEYHEKKKFDHKHKTVRFDFETYCAILGLEYGESIKYVNDDLTDNEYFFAVSGESDHEESIPCQYVDQTIEKIETNIVCEGIHPKNFEQLFLMDSIFNFPVTIGLGPAGTGKTLCALAAAIDLLIRKKEYKEIVMVKPISHVGESLGYLPGSLSEKMEPYFLSFYDALDQISPEYRKWLVDPEEDSGRLFGKYVLSFQPLTYLRGRTFKNTILILDEAQNCSRHEIKTFLSRVGEDSKVVVLGDEEQIDTKGLDLRSNALNILIENLSGNEQVTTVFLSKTERSKIAELAKFL